MFHRIAKGTAEAAKNFVNISATLSIRQQMRMASVYYSGLFDTASVHLPDKVTKKQDVPKGTEFYEKLCSFMAPNDILCSDIIVRSQKYKIGEVVVVKASDRDVLTVGVIHSILVRDMDVHFVIRKYEAFRNKLNYFVTEVVDVESTFIKPAQLGKLSKICRGLLMIFTSDMT